MKELAKLKVESLPDGSFVLTWDENDPEYTWLNGKTEEEIIAIIKQGLENAISEPISLRSNWEYL